MEQLRSALRVTRDEVPLKRQNVGEEAGTGSTAGTSQDANELGHEPLVYTDSSTFLKVPRCLLKK